MNFEIKGLPCFGAIAHLVGRAHGRSGNPGKLTYAEVVEMKRLYYEDKKKVSAIALQFGVTRANASSIIHGHSWKNAEVEL